MDLEAAVLGFIEISINLFRRLDKTYGLKRDSSEIFGHYIDELKAVKNIVEVIHRERSLRTSSIQAEILKLHRLGSKLNESLTVAQKRAQDMRRKFSSEFSVLNRFKGSGEEKSFSTILSQITAAKFAICLHIQISAVSVRKDAEDNLVAKLDVIEKVNDVLLDIIGLKGGLRIRTLLEHQPVRGEHSSWHDKDADSHGYAEDGTIVLSKEDAAALRLLVSTPSEKRASLIRERIVVNNVASESAFQINAPIGLVDLWADQERVVIGRDEAIDDQVQINYQNTIDAWDFISAWKQEASKNQLHAAMRNGRSFV